MFGLGTSLLIKIGLIVLLAGGLATGIVLHFKHDRENREELGAARERILHIEADLLLRTGEVMGLNDRIRASNAEKLRTIEAARVRVEMARIEATEARDERDRVTAALMQSRKSWDEVMKNDQKTRDWAVGDVPPAALERLRLAAGQTE